MTPPRATEASAVPSSRNLFVCMCFSVGILFVLSLGYAWVYGGRMVTGSRAMERLSSREQLIMDTIKKQLSDAVKAREFLGSPMYKNNENASLTIAAVTIDVYDDDRVKCAVESVVRGLPTPSRIVIMHGSDNIESKKQVLSHYIASGKIQLYNLRIPNRDMTFLMYSALLQHAVFYDIFDVDRLLVFQFDSVFCSKPDHRLEDFFQYDYIGAPWAWNSGGLGNGGFSLRNTRRMSQLLRDRRLGTDYEDLVISDAVRSDPNSVIPPPEARNQFSVESMYYPAPIGVHKIFDYGFSDEQYSQMLFHCPEISWITGSGCESAIDRGRLLTL